MAQKELGEMQSSYSLFYHLRRILSGVEDVGDQNDIVKHTIDNLVMTLYKSTVAQTEVLQVPLFTSDIGIDSQ
jgi:hypothetical protein